MTPELLAQFKRNYQEPSDVENEPTGVFNDIHALINALESAQRDADRYRWLRDFAVRANPKVDGGQMTWCVHGTSHGDSWPCEGKDLDSSIDEAMKP